ncbi:hypothetical protein BGW38_007150 [Lunasporangiospora selenospora]|uniref:XPG-I domain-containing protein n=1 Tax=Lunasporangiospora selenospora TaxID=979761 RepID=A0A9P6KG16_9FUNG|nr:hypothetical protein BGW38_007150 [Lunasporangiospora selenospora]
MATYVTYFMRRIEMFKFFGVKPYVVFDGGYLPSKSATEGERQSRRDDNRKQAMSFLRAGDTKTALEYFRKCVDVTPEMALAVIQLLQASGIDYVVAPYEADAQLAFLEKAGLIDGIVTEDSDLLVFGCKRVIFKMDQYGVGVEILSDRFPMVQEVSFQDWSITEFRHMCILSGCDYLPSLPGMGLKTAQRLLRRLKTADKVIRHIRMEVTSTRVQPDYEDSFRKADHTFLYARVYDPSSKSMVHLNTVPDDLVDMTLTDEFDFLGPALEQKVVEDIATGKINPITKVAFTSSSVQSQSRTPRSSYPGKENKIILNAQSKLSMPSTKSIHTYFAKVPTNPSAVAQGESQTLLKRKSLNPSVATRTKRCLGGDSLQSTTVSAKMYDTTTISFPKPNTPTVEDTRPSVIIEARSRFFGFEVGAPEEKPPSVPCVPRTSHITVRKSPKSIRTDSGIGLDEMGLLHDYDLSPLGTGNYEDITQSPVLPEEEDEIESWSPSPSPPPTPSPSPSLSQEGGERTRAEAKVIQGWRDKFSNISNASTARTPGLTRALPLEKTTPRSTVSPKISFQPNKTHSKSANAPRKLTRQASDGVVKIPSGRPLYHLSSARHTTAHVGTSGSTETTAVATATTATTTVLCLDRFRYTPK